MLYDFVGVTRAQPRGLHYLDVYHVKFIITHRQRAVTMASAAAMVAMVVARGGQYPLHAKTLHASASAPSLVHVPSDWTFTAQPAADVYTKSTAATSLPAVVTKPSALPVTQGRAAAEYVAAFAQYARTVHRLHVIGPCLMSDGAAGTYTWAAHYTHTGADTQGYYWVFAKDIAHGLPPNQKSRVPFQPLLELLADWQTHQRNAAPRVTAP